MNRPRSLSTDFRRAVRRWAIGVTTAVLAWSHRRQRVPPGASPVKVNVGCGLSVAEGWINIDGSISAWVAALPKPFHRLAYRLSGAHDYFTLDEYCRVLRHHRFVHHELAYGLPLADGTVDFILMSHLLEHLDRRQAASLLGECLRVLKEGGVIRVAVPDLEKAWRMYGRGEKERMLHDFFFVEALAAYAHHRWAYDFDLLGASLRAAGFTGIERCACGQGATPDLTALDNRAEYTLYVEARRPASEIR